MKVFVLACLVGVAVCAPRPQSYDPEPRPQTYASESLEEALFSPEPYQFSLAVADDEFTNYQNRHESQDENGLVQGEYSWVGPDSIRYITRYTADPINGFQVNTVEEQTDIKIRFPEPVPVEEQAGYRTGYE
ncbi:larval cuticle protein A2B-like [Eriocheir sinensis]|uniref:larval cuticle protein A2B-like n=1 Tax=Eriocheir sinensis TaxID=95602 RepID=UPI0021C9EE5E|nr:larval cuticle protein A2B-like [Eriocheir sinensis]